MTKTTKESAVLAALKAGHRLTRFDAERLLGDHVLPSTISTLRRKGNLIIDEWVWVPTRFGSEVHVKRYSYVGIAAHGQ